MQYLPEEWSRAGRGKRFSAYVLDSEVKLAIEAVGNSIGNPLSVFVEGREKIDARNFTWHTEQIDAPTFFSASQAVSEVVQCFLGPTRALFHWEEDSRRPLSSIWALSGMLMICRDRQRDCGAKGPVFQPWEIAFTDKIHSSSKDQIVVHELGDKLFKSLKRCLLEFACLPVPVAMGRYFAEEDLLISKDFLKAVK